MKKVFYLILLLVVFSACSTDEPNGPNTNDDLTDNKDESVTTKKPTALFTLKTEQPLKIFTNNRTINADSYLWSFGDGSTSDEKNPTHKYKSMGVYRVKLTATNSVGDEDTYETNVTIENPTKCYINQVSYNALSVNNEYVRMELLGNSVFSGSVLYSSSWSMVSTANMPFILNIDKTVEIKSNAIDGYDNGVYSPYEIYLYSTKRTNVDGYLFSSMEFEIDSSFPESLIVTDNKGNVVECSFMYR